MHTAADQARFIILDGDFEPAYLALFRSGELQKRAEEALSALGNCRICPRDCGADRLADKIGVCVTGRHPLVSSYFPHLGEEDCLRGSNGSGTIFFARCNLRCVFCQNFDISQSSRGTVTKPERLAKMMLELQFSGCHNINFVTPEHVVPNILEALVIAVEAGFRLPLVYNTSAYDSLDSLRWLNGVVDIYMPDFKMWDQGMAMRYLRAKNYPDTARTAIKEMHRQVGPLKMDKRGLAKRGVLLRHLVMPGETAGTPAVMQFLAGELSPDTYVNIMAQYNPAGKVNADAYQEINRRPTGEEIENAYAAARQAGLWRFDRRKSVVL